MVLKYFVGDYFQKFCGREFTKLSWNFVEETKYIIISLKKLKNLLVVWKRFFKILKILPQK